MKSLIKSLKRYKTVGYFSFFTGLFYCTQSINYNYLTLVYDDDNDRSAHIFLVFFNTFWTFYHYLYLLFFVDGSATSVDNFIESGSAKKNDNFLPNETINVDLKRFPKRCEHCATNPYKFERTSHCSTCEKCILRRDHHCLWIGKCVGVNNNAYFFRFCMWFALSYFHFAFSFVRYYTNRDGLTERYEVLQFTSSQYWFFWIVTFMATFTTATDIYQIYKQLKFIYNDVSYYEDMNPQFDYEYHYPFCYTNNTTYDHNPYNKNFLVGFYYLIGPSIISLFFPYPFVRDYDMLENTPICKKNKIHNPSEEQRFLKSINYPGLDAVLDDQQKKCDPENYMNIALQNYRDRIIV